MADQKPNYELERKRIAYDIYRLRGNIMQMELKKMELEDENRRTDINMAATIESIKGLEERMNSLPKE